MLDFRIDGERREGGDGVREETMIRREEQRAREVYSLLGLCNEGEGRSGRWAGLRSVESSGEDLGSTSRGKCSRLEPGLGES